MADGNSISPGNRIIPHLWFDKEAKEAAAFYCSVFPDSQVNSTATISDTPSGDSQLVTFTLWGHSFMAISAGPFFTINPSISFMVIFDSSREKNAETLIDEVWSRLSEGGTPQMPLDEYPFSKRYGWIQDKYGVNWQLMLADPEDEPRPTILPCLTFTGEQCGKTEEARAFYLSVFRNAKPGSLFRYGPGHEPNGPETVMYSDYMLENTWFVAADSVLDQPYPFNEAISLYVRCETQEEIDYYWNKLSAVPEAEQCGWLKDKYGISWQISPAVLDDMMTTGTPEQRARITQAFLKMKKFDLAELHRAFDGK